jgi:hypothetical protein
LHRENTTIKAYAPKAVIGPSRKIRPRPVGHLHCRIVVVFAPPLPPPLPKDLNKVSKIIIQILSGDGRNATKNAIKIGLPAS